MKIKHVPFMASWHGDFNWLPCALRSHKRYGIDWEPPLICTDAADAAGAEKICEREFPEARVVVLDTPPGGTGYLRAQCAMLSPDTMSDADYFWLFGSDTVLTGPLSPYDLWSHDYALPVMLYTPHASLGRITERWKIGTEAALGWPVEHEFMRRLPLPYPRTLHPGVRARLAEVHRMPWDQYVHSTAVHGARPGYGSSFSESNVMGAYAWQRMHGIYAWVNTDTAGHIPIPVHQFWSHGGMESPDARTGKRQGDMLREWGLL